eukprot:6607321-Lingulodinium_polyedra.AAC.1
MASSGSRFKKLFPPFAPGMLLTAESATVNWATGAGAIQEDVAVSIAPATEAQARAPLPSVRPAAQ